MDKTLICQFCGKEFVGRWNRKYCSTFCFEEHVRAWDREYSRRRYAENPELCKARTQDYYLRNKEKHIASVRRYYQEHKEKQNENAMRWHNKNPEKVKAHWKLMTAIRWNKIIVPSNCSICGISGKRICGHHKDYTKPLDVVWVCDMCHRALHRQEKAEKALIPLEIIERAEQATINFEEPNNNQQTA